MMANAALAALVIEFLLLGWLAGELQFLAPHKRLLFRMHGPTILTTALVLYLNLCAVCYAVARWLFLRDAGRKLRHLDHQLGTADAVLDDLGEQLS